MQEIGISIPESLTPKKVTDEMLASADYIISFECLVPSMFPPDKFEKWTIASPEKCSIENISEGLLDII